MKTKRLVAMLAMAGGSLSAGHRATEQRATVTVCIDPDPQVLLGVLPLATAMFASIGVRIDWRERDSCPAGAGGIRIRLLRDSASIHDSGAEALAFARPYEGSIVVFLDRVQGFNHNGGPSVLAHVLVHEITHVLEGIDRHSPTGIMKAHWSRSDYLELRCKPLPFAEEDVDLIYAGLKAFHAIPAAAAIRAKVAGQ